MKLAVLRSVSREAPVLLAGPTAAGKSALALELAARDGRVVVNADALQVYGCWRVLTARPTLAEAALVPHALYGHLGRDQDYSVGHWLREVAVLLDRKLVIVGGTGLNFAALTGGLAEIPPVPAAVRVEADALRLAGGLAAMVAGLDAKTAARIDLRNPMRVQRAWEVLRATGRGLALWQDETAAPLLPLAAVEALVLRPGTGWLNDRIAQRFSAMVEGGALEEVAALRPFWAPPAPWTRAIGAPELMAHLQGRLTLDQAIEDGVLASRQYAKRQRTWFRSRMAGWRDIVPG